jgi:hypothetical protein
MNRKQRNTRKMAQRKTLKMLDSRLAHRKAIEADFMTLLEEVGRQVFPPETLINETTKEDPNEHPATN